MKVFGLVILSFLLAIGVPLALCKAMEAVISSQEKTMTAFHVGDCLFDTYERESWEPPAPILKILLVGKRNYATCFIEYCPDINSLDLPFSDADRNYKLISCPQTNNGVTK